MNKKFQQPIIKLSDQITHNPEQGYWEILPTAPDDLKAVRIGKSGLCGFLKIQSDDPVVITKALQADLKRFEKLVWSIEIDDWANDYDIAPVFKPEAK